jgi:hypothetical protein
MHFHLPNLTNPTYIKQLREVIFPSIQNAVGICMQIIILIFYEVSYGLVTLLKLIYFSI